MRGEGKGEADVCSVTFVVVAACVLGRMVTGADAWSAGVVPLGSADGCALTWIVRQGPSVCVRSQLSSRGL